MPNDQTNLARKMADVDRLIHEPARLLIVTILAMVDSADFLYLQRETELSKGNLSSHLAKLEEAGYIQIEKTYREKIPLTLCSLTPQGRQAFEGYRRHIKDFLEKSD
jgi:DNA-binding MarR family transcriptional regulator